MSCTSEEGPYSLFFYKMWIYEAFIVYAIVAQQFIGDDIPLSLIVGRHIIIFLTVLLLLGKYWVSRRGIFSILTTVENPPVGLTLFLVVAGKIKESLPLFGPSQELLQRERERESRTLQGCCTAL